MRLAFATPIIVTERMFAMLSTSYAKCMQSERESCIHNGSETLRFHHRTVTFLMGRVCGGAGCMFHMRKKSHPGHYFGGATPAEKMMSARVFREGDVGSQEWRTVP